jgi:23S rRNA pseudouridine2605 synthase
MASGLSHEGESFSLARFSSLPHFDAMRLNRFLAAAGLGSRRAVEELITAGRVRINGQLVTELATQVQPGDSVKVGQRLIQRERPLTAILHKPKGYVSTASDELDRKTIFDLLPHNWPRVFHVGRLDKDSEGVLLLTNDGELAQQLTHPSHRIEKEYEVTLDRPIEPEHLDKLERGVAIEDGRARAERATILSPGILRIVLTQGFNRQIHKMLWRVGKYDIKRLVRLRMGSITLRALPPGKWRLVTARELESLLPATQGNAPRKGNSTRPTSRPRQRGRASSGSV